MANVLRHANIPGVRIRNMIDENTGLRVGLCVSSSRAITRDAGRGRCQPLAVFLDDMAIGHPESFLESVSAQDVTSFQFIPGIEAGVLYGPRGFNGVLLIYTRRR